MPKLNTKFFDNISDIDLVKLYGDEVISIFDYSENDLSQEQLKIKAKASISNFITQLIEYLEKIRT